MLIPPSWQNTDLMDSDEKAFHEYNSMHMEAWDGPALICFQDKNFLSCFLDRNGLRPAKIEFLMMRLFVFLLNLDQIMII